MSEVNSSKVEEWLDRYGVNYSVEFVPFSKSRHAVPNPTTSELSINWRCSFQTPNGRVFTCDFTQGIGHLPPSLRYTGRPSIHQIEHIRRAAEHGKLYSDTGLFVIGRLLPPLASDVLECLTLDQNVEDYVSFEEWADDSGYDRDSRHAEKTYLKCVDDARRLRAVLGAAAVNDLRNIYLSS